MVTHDICLQGANLGAGPSEKLGPVLLQRTDQEFLAAVLDQLPSQTGHQELAKDIVQPAQTGGTVRLFQPVHRTFHLVLLEALCERPGRPRLDPERIDSAGLVVRRRAADGRGVEGWLESGNQLRGWQPFDERTGPDPLADPDPTRRPARLAGEPPEVRRSLALARPAAEPFAERVSALFVAPPEVCAAAGKTLLYGLVPVTSSERSEEEPAAARYDDEGVRQQILQHLSPLLRTKADKTGYDWLGRTLRADNLAAGGHFQMLQICLEQLLIELDAFDSAGQQGGGTPLLGLLNQIALPYGDRGERPAGQLLERAARVLINREQVAASQFGEADDRVLMPDFWPAIDSALRQRIFEQALRDLEDRASVVTPGEGRYASPEDIYELRAFVRVRRRDGCPPLLVWTQHPSHPFTIVPWFESGDAPPVQISLPDATDRDFLSKLKPDVAFSVPENIFNQLRGTSLEKLMNGEPSNSGTIGLGWICGFNIPIITLCAFFVLSIFLSLLNFLFFWLPFVKICIPFPKKN